ncbi:hypothetical protein [Reyranella sp.]|uniref:hypothetical protein n=1 Tax=Reyranella sp. TaxID=1929291 RepID=UPI003C7A283D
MNKRSGKNFNANVKCRDLLIDLQGLSDGAAAAFMKFWMHHHLHGVPLPPREEQVDDVDEYFRDLLGMKNVRTWRKARDELVGKARLRVTDEGRFYMRRTMREVGREAGPWDLEDDDNGSESGGGGGQQGGTVGGASAGGQGRLPLMRVVSKSVDQPVDEAGQAATLGDVCPNIDGSSADVCPNIERCSADVAIQPIHIKRKWVRPFIVSSSPSPFDHEFAAALMAPPRARGDPGRPLA